jgi:hypothetical protein
VVLRDGLQREYRGRIAVDVQVRLMDDTLTSLEHVMADNGGHVMTHSTRSSVRDLPRSSGPIDTNQAARRDERR